MKIVVGSLNPVKVEATRKAFQRYWNNVMIQPMKTNSGVNEMPLTEEDCIKGAINRAKSVNLVQADYYVGLEGGAYNTKFGMVVVGWAAVRNMKGEIGLGSSGRFFLPEYIAKKLRKGVTLGKLIESISSIKNIKQKQGAVGFATLNQITRSDFLESAIIFSLTKFVNPTLYQNEL